MAPARSDRIGGIKRQSGKKAGGGLPPELVDLHRGLNRETAPRWEDFSTHRARVTELVLRCPGQSCALLGAGNCNDVDLEALAGRFAEVHLFDLDKEALLRARQRLGAEVAARVIAHEPVDLGGSLVQLRRFRNRPATAEELGAFSAESVAQALARVPDRFDVVASTCVLSQLVYACDRFLGPQHPQVEVLACAVVVAHLRLLAALVKPGGRGLLLTDMVSSDTYPLDDLWGQRDPWALVEELETAGNHLSGTTPKFTRRIVNTDPVIAPLVASSELETPWLWRISEDETYLVYGLQFTRRV